ncbi:hypothetical protein ABPG75_004171 [Micractinium tetrahymenae]
MPTVTAYARALRSSTPAGYTSPRPTNSKVMLFRGSQDAWREQQTQGCKAPAAQAPYLSRTDSPHIPASYAADADAAAGSEAWPALPSTVRPAPPACLGCWATRGSQLTTGINATCSSSDNSSTAGPSTPAAADAPYTAFADDVAPLAAAKPAAKACPPPPPPHPLPR